MRAWARAGAGLAPAAPTDSDHYCQAGTAEKGEKAAREGAGGGGGGALQPAQNQF